MKKLLFAFILCIYHVISNAAPVYPGQWQNIVLADGTTVRAEFVGDECCSYYRSGDGRCFSFNDEARYFEQVSIESLIQKTATMRTSMIESRGVNRTSNLTKSATAKSTEIIGNRKGLVILVQFQDVRFEEGHDLVLYNRILNEEGFVDEEKGFVNSVRDYFHAQSSGQFDLEFDIYGPYTTSENMAFYGANSGTDNWNSKNVAQMIYDACAAFDSEIDFSKYDWDGDGYVDQVFILFAGQGENFDKTNTDAIWPHEWQLYSASGGTLLPVFDGVRVNTYGCSCELGVSKNIDGIGTFCHEFSHCLGLPDMYDTSGSGHYDMSRWSVMATGCYISNGFRPCNYTSYERMYAGWEQPVELKDDCRITGMKALGDGGVSYIIYNDAVPTEYFLLENRQKVGCDAGIYGTGLLVIHVDYDAALWASNKINASSTSHCYVVPADNDYASNSATNIKGDTYPYINTSEDVTITNDSFSATSLPAAEWYHEDSEGKKYINKPITQITNNADGTVSFVFGNPEPSTSIKDILSDEIKNDNRIYSIDGTYLGTDISKLDKGLYIIGGKKMVR
ncbi:MAG: M6 family metalloprotease domain-containing protein [Prevotella sp.]